LLPSYGNSPYDATVAIELIRSGRVLVKELVTHRLPLDKAQEGFQLVAGSGESIKVVLRPHS
jgi:L-iditol 2-dehydrogenase